MNRFRILFLFLLLHCFLVSCEEPPHIIMIVADDLGFDDVSFHGSSQIPTPNIDKLAKNGIILNNYYVLPVCTPTRSAIMTGRYPINTGMQSGTIYAPNPWGVDLKEKMLPEYLKKVGYKTHAVGKWHLGFFAREYTPTRRGFDSFYGSYGGTADYWDHSLAMSGYWGLDLHKDTPTSSETIWDQWGNYSTRMFSMEAVDRIRNHDLTDPMFLYLSFQAVHSANREDPVQAPQKWVRRFNHIKHIGRRKYAAMVAYMDFGVGMVYNELERRGMLDNSIIIFTSDNGGPVNGFNMNWASNYPLRGTKSSVYEGGVRAAGCIYSKIFKKPGSVSTDLMHATDWLPTLLSIAGYDITQLENLDGMNMWKTLQYGIPSPRKELLINIDPNYFKNAALRVGNWKLIDQSRFYDGWYKPPGFEKKKKQANQVNSKFKRKMKIQQSSEATVKCPPRPPVVPHCGGKKYKPCLFNLKNDPCEYTDLSKKFPIIYKIMLSKLAGYKRKMIKPRRTTFRDPRANPKKHHGVWVPWKELKPKKTSFFNMFRTLPYPFTCSWKE